MLAQLAAATDLHIGFLVCALARVQPWKSFEKKKESARGFCCVLQTCWRRMPMCCSWNAKCCVTFDKHDRMLAAVLAHALLHIEGFQFSDANAGVFVQRTSSLAF